MKSININFIPHKNQRYATCGDWYEEDDETIINVSAELTSKQQLLVAVHELIEMGLCRFQGVTEFEVDRFDRNFNGLGEPGDSMNAPYYRQHQIATGIERILAAELNIDWQGYEQCINNLD